MPVTLTQFLIEQQRQFPQVSGNFTLLLNDIVVACKKISHLVNQGDLIGVLGNANSENFQGEVQKKLDIWSHEIMVAALNWKGDLAGMASEEVEEPIQIPQKNYPKGHYLANHRKGPYLALFDPLDGSSNIDVNLTVGTIFSILRCPENVVEPELKDFLQQGTQQVCAGFALYGPATMLILTNGQGVNGFTLNHDIGEFMLTHPNITIPTDTQEFAINLSNQRHWELPMQKYIAECLAGKDGVRGKDFNMRWLASLVAEVYRILTRGGVFMYPFDFKDPTKAGRLRLMYEANPIAMIIEQAGGACSTGRERIMDIQPTSLHQRVPLVLGSKNEVERIVSYHLSADKN